MALAANSTNIQFKTELTHHNLILDKDLRFGVLYHEQLLIRGLEWS